MARKQPGSPRTLRRNYAATLDYVKDNDISILLKPRLCYVYVLLTVVPDLINRCALLLWGGVVYGVDVYLRGFGRCL